MIIIGIDPGTSNTGVAVWDDEEQECIECYTIKTKKSGQSQEDLLKRCNTIQEALSMLIFDYAYDSTINVVIEGFTSFGGLRQSASTFQTPFLVGYLCALIRIDAIQTSRDVFGNKKGNMSNERESMKNKTSLIKGAEKAKNDHERSALCHALYYANGGKW